MKTGIIICSLVMLIGGLSCVSLSSWITPAPIDKNAVKYSVDAGVADPNEFKGYPNLAKAEELMNKVDSAHAIIQFELQQKIQKDNLDYGIHRDITASNFTIGQQREKTLFGEKGLLSMGLSLIGFGSFTGILGLMRKRPGDVTKEELQQAIAQATGETNGQLTEKQKQLVELVQGIQLFINSNKDKLPDIITELKSIFDKTQDTNTQVAVAEIKKTNLLS